MEKKIKHRSAQQKFELFFFHLLFLSRLADEERLLWRRGGGGGGRWTAPDNVSVLGNSKNAQT